MDQKGHTTVEQKKLFVSSYVGFLDGSKKINSCTNLLLGEIITMLSQKKKYPKKTTPKPMAPSKRMNPQDILCTQHSVSEKFQDGRVLTDVIDQLIKKK